MRFRVFDALTPAALAARAPDLRVGGEVAVTAGSPIDGVELARRGWTALSLVDGDTCQRLVAVIESLRADVLPPVAVYAFDEVWAVAEALRLRIEAALGPYALVEDFWAFAIDPGQAGWPPHRGTYDSLARDRPEWLNAWVALTDVEEDRSCMHFVPLDEDAALCRRDLDDVAFDANAVIRAPLSRGAALLWNANVLHWGGASANTRKEPRVSLTFTFTRVVTPRFNPELLDGWQRLDAIAGQIALYGDKDPALSEDVRFWATQTASLGRRQQ